MAASRLRSSLGSRDGFTTNATTQSSLPRREVPSQSGEAMTIHVVLSGGLDSTCALAVTVKHAWASGEEVRAIGFRYGQKHVREIDAATAVCAHYGIAYEMIDLSGLFSGSALLEGDERQIPREDYANGNMSDTVVQGRNLLFASVAIAQARPGDSIVFGVHGGDHDIYPDCREEFWKPLGDLVSTAYGVEIITPFLFLTKAGIISETAPLSVPLGRTWSCYEGGHTHCGKCATCRERREAFRLAGTSDPTIYEEEP